ncbi:MAG: ABC transporter substrate-binding protein [Pseudomonadota bacterium]
MVHRFDLDRRRFLTRATALGLSAATARTLAGVRQAAAQTAPRTDLARIAMPLPALTDPRHFVRSEAANVCRGWLEYLVEYQRDGAFVGVLLDTWTVEDAARTYRLTLRAGVTWSNGDPFTAADVAHNITRWCDAGDPANSMATRMAALIDPDTQALRTGGVEVADDLTLILRLARPDTTLIAGCADYPAAIVHPSYGGGDPWQGAIGTGPYLPDGPYMPGQSAALQARADWWGSDVVGGPFLDRIEFVDLGPDPAAPIRALNASEIDLIDGATGVAAGVLDTQGYPRSEVPSTATLVLRARAATDFDGFKPYELPEVRQAIALAIDPELPLDLALSGAGELAANHHVAPSQPDYAEVGAPRHAPGEARSVLDTVGMLEFPHQLISPRTGWVADTADVMAAMLNDAGLSVDRVTLPDADFWADWRAHPFAVTPWAGRPFGLQTLALGYTTGSAWNETGYANAEFDAKIAAAQALDPAARQGLMAELQGMLLADGVIIQPYWRRLMRHTRRAMVGAEAHPGGELHLYKLGFAA